MASTGDERAQQDSSSEGLSAQAKHVDLERLVSDVGLLSGLGADCGQHDILLSHLTDVDRRWTKYALNAEEKKIAFDIYSNLLKDIKGGATLENVATRLRGDITELFAESQLSFLHCEDVVEEVVCDLFRHFHLFAFLLREKRLQEREQVAARVNQPLPVAALCEGVPQEVWRKQQHLLEMKRQHAKEIHHLDQHHEQELEICRQKVEQELAKLPPAVSRNELGTVVETVLSSHFTVTGKELTQKIATLTQEVVMETKQVSLSRAS